MPKKPDERIVQAKQMYLDGMKLVEIASQLSLPEGTVRRWKSTHKWDNERSDKKDANVRKKRGGQKGNKNATGPPRNQHARKHGLFARYLPPGLNQIIEDMPTAPLDIILDQIQILYANLLHSQSILYVENKDDKTTEVTLRGEATAYEYQQAWDKQRNNMGSLSRSMKDLTSLIKTYEELASKSTGMISEEQKARIAQLKAQTKKLEENDNLPDDSIQKKMDAIDDIRLQMQAPKDDEL